jgi:hypothetical protein
LPVVETIFFHVMVSQIFDMRSLLRSVKWVTLCPSL